jgi:uncharacterized membrane protein YhaH (DUF805 family)
MSTAADRFLEEKLRKKQEPIGSELIKDSGVIAASSPAMSYSSELSTPSNSFATNTKPEWFSIEGRLNRMDYFLRVLIMLPVALIGFGFIEAGGKKPVFALIGLLLLLGAVGVNVFQQIKRLHDLDLSGWFALLGCIPIVNLFFGLYVLFCPGTEGPNQYGPAARR